MATLHQQYIDFNGKLALTTTRRDSLKSSRRDLRAKIRKSFRANHDGELQPRFGGQGSIMMDTTINPIPVYDASSNKLLEYDLDDGIYFIESSDESNRKSVETWHEWVYDAVDGHTAAPPERHNACVRVIFADGHHIDLPIYYKLDDQIELAHRVDRWTISDPKEFYEWFNEKKKNNRQLERLVRYFKGWKDYQEKSTDFLSFPNGVSLSILAANNQVASDNDDIAFEKTASKMLSELQKSGGFKCLRPTTPKGEDLFDKFSASRRQTFLDKLDELVEACANARTESNQRKATEYLRAQFGDRFPLGADIEETDKSARLAAALGSARVIPVPYAN